jgi:hypothetical protein
MRWRLMRWMSFSRWPEEALTGWTAAMQDAGNPIPPTRDLSEISNDPEWEESLAESVFLIAVPAPVVRKERAAA